jgi:hypothetical protein
MRSCVAPRTILVGRVPSEEKENMGKLFGTDGIRGVANVHPMTTAGGHEAGEQEAFGALFHHDPLPSGIAQRSGTP